jgi:cytochrome c2
MNKEVGYIMQGFLLLVVVLATFETGQFLLSIPYTQGQEKEVDKTCGNALSGAASKGSVLFRENCASCHSVTKTLTGPALMDVTKRITDKKLLYSWIRNSQAVLQTNNPYFKKLVREYDNIIMTSFPHLTDEEIADILQYIESY